MPPKTKSSFKESRLPSDSSIEPKVLAMMVGIEQLPLWSCPPCPSLSEGRTESTMSVVGSSTSETNLPEDVVLIDGNAMKMTSRSEKPGYIEIASSDPSEPHLSTNMKLKGIGALFEQEPSVEMILQKNKGLEGSYGLTETCRPTASIEQMSNTQHAARQISWQTQSQRKPLDPQSISHPYKRSEKGTHDSTTIAATVEILPREIEPTIESGTMIASFQANKVKKEETRTADSQVMIAMDETPASDDDVTIMRPSSSCLEDGKAKADVHAEQSCHMVLLKAKHVLLVALMREVYTIYDRRWQVNANKRGGSQESTGTSFGFTESSSNSDQEQRKSGKRQKRENSLPQRGDDNRRRSRGWGTHSLKKDGEPRLPCHFHVYDPEEFNVSTNSQYRACEGPGFDAISHLRQHFRRVHRFIQCMRCWQTFKHTQALNEHLINDTRCEREIPNPIGIDDDKWTLISRRGITWEEIYGILFPGAPPSPYMESHGRVRLEQDSASPPSDHLQDFDAYNRRHLPRLVDAHLSASISSDLAPLEEKMREMLADTIRTCQFIVFQKYQMLNMRRSSPQVDQISFLRSSSNSICQLSEETHINQPGLSQVLNTEPVYVEPDQIAFSQSAIAQTPLSAHQSFGPDSGYGSTSTENSQHGSKCEMILSELKTATETCRSPSVSTNTAMPTSNSLVVPPTSISLTQDCDTLFDFDKATIQQTDNALDFEDVAKTAITVFDPFED